MKQSESTIKLSTAMVKAQAKFERLHKEKTGQEGNLKFKYVELGDAINMARPLMNEEGVFFSQPIEIGANGELRVTTRIQLQEEFLQSDGLPLPPLTPGKEMGKVITYARRIDFMPFFGLVGEEDEDAPDLTRPDPSKPKNYAPFKPQPKPSPSVPAVQINKSAPDPLTITDDDIPDFNTPTVVETPLPAEAREAIDHIMAFVPLTKERNDEIQNHLKELVTNKTLDRRKLSLFLEAEHEGKKSIDVPASTWENTVKKINEAVASGPEAVKELMKVAK